jgi:hypothetical protein
MQSSSCFFFWIFRRNAAECWLRAQDSKNTIETPRGQAWSTKLAGAWRSKSRAARVLMHPQTGVLHLGCIIRHIRRDFFCEMLYSSFFFWKLRHDAAGCWLRTQDSKNTIRYAPFVSVAVADISSLCHLQSTYMCKKWGQPPAKHASIVAPLFPLTIPRTLNPKSVFSPFPFALLPNSCPLTTSFFCRCYKAWNLGLGSPFQ